MNAPPLQTGDIVSINRGLVVFVGGAKERRQGDVRAAEPGHHKDHPDHFRRC